MLSSYAQQKMVDAMPIGACVFTGPEHTINAINQLMLVIWAKDNSVIGKTLYEAIPELKEQGFFELLSSVYTNGNEYRNPHGKAMLMIDGELQERYFDFSFKPLCDRTGTIYGIVNTAVDITERVVAETTLLKLNNELKAAIEELAATNEEYTALNEELNASNEEIKTAYQQLGEAHHSLLVSNTDQVRSKEIMAMAVEAAGLGTWNMDPVTRALEYNDTLARIFGYEGEAPMTYQQAIGQVLPEYRQEVVVQIKRTIAAGGVYDVIFQQRRFSDQVAIWLRSVGKVIHTENNQGYIFTGVIMDITEQVKNDQRKNDFISIVSHELKTPLTSMNGYVQILTARAIKQEDHLAATMLDKAGRQVQRMSTLINSFLNVSRLESGQLQIDRKPFDLAGLVMEVEDEIQSSISSHLFVFEPLERTMVFADQDKIGQVINNFITNAVKYSPIGSTIQVACLTHGGIARLSVKDEGMGVAEQNKDKLFERFYRVEGEQTRSIAGFGIGLYLCAEIIRQHEGQIGVDSKLSEGSTFWFTLPVLKG